MSENSGFVAPNALHQTNEVVSYIEGLKIKVIGLEDLKKNKKAVSRFKDLDDLENLK